MKYVQQSHPLEQPKSPPRPTSMIEDPSKSKKKLSRSATLNPSTRPPEPLPEIPPSPLVQPEDAAVVRKKKLGATRKQRPVTLAIAPTTVVTTNEPPQQPRPTELASKTLQLSDLIVCAICLEQLRRPTMLSCQHTFCLACLQNCAKSGSSLLITCPTCRMEIVLPEGGVDALPVNILLTAFLESLQPNGGGTNSVPVRVSSVIRRNKERPGCVQCARSDPAALHPPCDHCQLVFCNSCHLAHAGELTKLWKETMEELSSEDHRLSLIKEESKARSKKLRENIQASIGIQVQQLCDKQEQLLAELKVWRKTETARLAEVQQLCQDVMSLVAGSSSSSQDQAGNPSAESAPLPNAELLKRATSILAQARQCGTARLTLNEEELTLVRESVLPAQPENGLTPGGGGGKAPPSIESSPVQLRRRGASSSEPPEPTQSRRVTFLSAGQHDLEEGSSSGGRKTFIDPPATPDDQSLFYRSKSGTPKHRFVSSHLQRPAGLAISPWTGEIYVAATDSHRVYVIDRGTGRILRSLGSPYRSGSEDGGGGGVNGGVGGASSQGTFLCPFGVAFSILTQEIYVTDKWLNCIQVFDKEENHVRQIGTKGTGPGHFRSPQGIACDPRTGLLYVADSCNDRVQVLDRNGTYVRELGCVSQMTLPGGKVYTKREFNEPTGVTVSADGSRVAVSDFGNCRVKVFNAGTGERITEFGYRGTQRGQFQNPESIVMDDKGFILVGDNGNGRIQIFRQNGNFVRALGTKGSGAGQFNWISGLALGPDMEIIATDFKNHCIQIF